MYGVRSHEEEMDKIEQLAYKRKQYHRELTQSIQQNKEVGLPCTACMFIQHPYNMIQ